MTRLSVLILFSSVVEWTSALSLSRPETALAHLRDRVGSSVNTTKQCKCFPGDPDGCWPSSQEWATFNATVGGRLVATVPIAAVCHDDNFTTYDADACDAIRNTWALPETHYTTSSSPMADWFANSSCDPFTEPADRCVLGTYVQYAVRATGVSDYQATLAFAAKHNIRLVIRNTGHDYLGKSTGAGALALWTHYLKDISLIDDYTSTAYSGTAMTIGAGVQAFEAYSAAAEAGLVVVGGDCDTVGLAGGYTQGGGTGPLVSVFGMGADQVLEWEVVTAEGLHLVASPTENEDLYWALSGGGGGTYAAVVSATVRTHPTMKVAGASLTFATADTDVLSDVVKTFLAIIPSLVDAGAWASFLVLTGVFQINPILAPNMNVEELQSILDPFLAALNSSGVSYDLTVSDFDTFSGAYDAFVPTNNVTEYNIGGRLVPRSNLESNSSIAELWEAFEFIMGEGAVISGICNNQTNFPLGGVENSVNPAFRESVITVVIGLAFDYTSFAGNIPLQETITNSIIPALEAITPGSGAYLNEADVNQPDWQTTFYGDNYQQLLSIKDKYDPHGLFYAQTAVGSERWEYRMATDGRLCQV